MAPGPPAPNARGFGGQPDLRARSPACSRRSSAGACATLGDLARLPRGGRARAAGRARRAPASGGVRRRRSRRSCRRTNAARFVERLELEWPIEGLEPLSFVLARLCDALSAALERADRGAVAVTTTAASRDARRRTSARSICRRRCATRACCARSSCSISSRIRPPAAIDVVDVEAGVAPGAHRAGLAARAHAADRRKISRRSSRASARSWASPASARRRSSTRYDERAVGHDGVQGDGRVRGTLARSISRPLGPWAPGTAGTVSGAATLPFAHRRPRHRRSRRARSACDPSARGLAGGAVRRVRRALAIVGPLVDARSLGLGSRRMGRRTHGPADLSPRPRRVHRGSGRWKLSLTKRWA